jgi:hypothetical protein
MLELTQVKRTPLPGALIAHNQGSFEIKCEKQNGGV